LRNIAGSNSWAGAITLGSASNIQSDAGTLTLIGGITKAGSLLTIQARGTPHFYWSYYGSGGLTRIGTAHLRSATAQHCQHYTGLTTVSAGESTLTRRPAPTRIAGAAIPPRPLTINAVR